MPCPFLATVNLPWHACSPPYPKPATLHELASARPAASTLVSVPETEVITDTYLAGDHARPKAGVKRQITTIT